MLVGRLVLSEKVVELTFDLRDPYLCSRCDLVGDLGVVLCCGLVVHAYRAGEEVSTEAEAKPQAQIIYEGVKRDVELLMGKLVSVVLWYLLKTAQEKLTITILRRWPRIIKGPIHVDSSAVACLSRLVDQGCSQQERGLLATEHIDLVKNDVHLLH